MALTSTQKAQCRMWLGYSDMSRNTPVHWPLENALLALSTEAEVIVGDILTRLTTIDTSLTSTTGISALGLKSVDNGGVVWQDGATAVQQATAARAEILVNRLATILGVSVVKDSFRSSVSGSGFMGIG